MSFELGWDFVTYRKSKMKKVGTTGEGILEMQPNKIKVIQKQ